MAEPLLIYVRLMGEGTECFRPTHGIEVATGLYKLLPTPGYDPDDEVWEFPPDSTVRVEQKMSGSHNIMVAVKA